MAGLRSTETLKNNAAPEQAAPELFDEVEGVVEESESESDDKLLFAKSTDVRRRIEEKLEVRLLRDELGIDDFDVE